MKILTKIIKGSLSSLKNVSPIDGRYAGKTQILSNYFSEWALMKHRIIVESQWLLHMLDNRIIEEDKNCSRSQIELQLNNLIKNFDEKGGNEIKNIEKVTNHDLKSVQYYVKKYISGYKEHIHFCCTSQDVNNLAYALMLKKSINEVMVPKSQKIVQSLIGMSQKWAECAMLARTHGQSASPTTLGKEYANFTYRLSNQVERIRNTAICGKFNGAVGNYNAHIFAYPDLNWLQISRSFVENRLDLTFNPYTTQIESHDSLCRVMSEFGVFNTILIGLCRDTWQYISKGYMRQKIKEGEVGSSTMPHKVNPIDFQNCQGNLGLANSLIDHFRNKLPISRQQRDLSDSTVLRNQGTILGYSLIAYDSLLKGCQKLDANSQLMIQQLHNHLEVVTEAIQTELRKVGYNQPYELLKKLSRGRSFSQEVRQSLLKELKDKIPQDSFKKIEQIRAEKYLGNAVELAKNINKQYKFTKK